MLFIDTTEIRSTQHPLSEPRVLELTEKYDHSKYSIGSSLNYIKFKTPILFSAGVYLYQIAVYTYYDDKFKPYQNVIFSTGECASYMYKPFVDEAIAKGNLILSY